MIPNQPDLSVEGCLSLGIDIGTTKVACCVVDVATRQPLMAHSIRHKSDVGGLREGRSEQEVGRILQALDEAIEQLPIGCRGRVRSLGLTGQMHGVVLWGRDFSDTVILNPCN